MSNLNLHIESTKFGGFTSYKNGQVVTLKPGIANQYHKDVYSQISNYHSQSVPYFNDKKRNSTVYNEEYIETLKEDNYKNKNKAQINIDLDNYQYKHDNNIRDILNNGNKIKNEEIIRSKFSDSTNSFGRKTAFSHWKSNYSDANNEMLKNKSNTYSSSIIFDHFKPKYHKYHKAFYNTENSQTIGIDGSIPLEKYNDTSQKFNNTTLMHNDNYILGLGTTKVSTYIPGYKGFIPKDSQPIYSTIEKDPYISLLKANHLINYNTRIPNYSGSKTINPINMKGEPRPFCLSTKGEKFN